MNRNWFKDKVVVVTGGASGIGRGSVKRFLQEGAQLVVGDYNSQYLHSLHEEVGDDVLMVKMEVNSAKDNERLINETIDRFGQIDVVHANAGISDGFLNIFQTDETLWDRIIDVNLKGYYLVCKTAIPKLIETKGNIVMTCSTASFYSNKGGLAYTAAKHGALGLVRELAYELAPHGVRVNAIAPAATATNMSREEGGESAFTPELLQHIKSETPLQRYGTPEDCANTVAFLASEQAAHITGQVFLIDGGMSIKGI